MRALKANRFDEKCFVWCVIVAKQLQRSATCAQTVSVQTQGDTVRRFTGTNNNTAFGELGFLSASQVMRK